MASIIISQLLYLLYLVWVNLLESSQLPGETNLENER